MESPINFLELFTWKSSLNIYVAIVAIYQKYFLPKCTKTWAKSLMFLGKKKLLFFRPVHFCDSLSAFRIIC